MSLDIKSLRRRLNGFEGHYGGKGGFRLTTYFPQDRTLHCFVNQYGIFKGHIMRTKKSSIKGELATFQAIKKELHPAFALTPEQNAYFVRIVQGREFETWTGHDLAVASELAVTISQLDRANAAIDSAGIILPSGKQNPAISAKATLTGAVVSLTRILGLSASQKGLGRAEQKVRNQREIKTRRISEQTGGDGLILGLDDDGLI